MIFLPEAASAYHRNHSNFKPFKFRQLPSGKLNCRRRRPADIGYSDSESATSGARAFKLAVLRLAGGESGGGS